MSSDLRRPRGRPKTEHPRGNGKPVRIAPELHRKASTMASHREIDLGELVSGLLAPALEREYGKFVAELKGG
jgi:predicted HicB family RNase H-like nuclease